MITLSVAIQTVFGLLLKHELNVWSAQDGITGGIFATNAFTRKEKQEHQSFVSALRGLLN